MWKNMGLNGFESKHNSELDSKCEDVLGVFKSFFRYFPFYFSAKVI